MIVRLLDRVMPGSAWHRHRNVKCRECKTTVHSSAVCVSHSMFWTPIAAFLCWVPRITLCTPCIERVRARDAA